MVYLAKQARRTGADLPYLPKPLDSLTPTIEELLPQVKSKSNRTTKGSVKDDYVTRTLLNEPERPPVTWSNWYKEVNWPQATLLCLEPFIALYGICTTSFMWQTIAFASLWYLLTGLGITAGYHRLFAHRAYEATVFLRYILLIVASGAVQGSARWWARGHRAHHRYTDTDLDPYSAHKSIWYAHIGWMLIKPRRKPGAVDSSDLARDEVVQWQHKYYLPLALLMAFIMPTLICGLGWGDYRGGYFYAAVLRLVLVHHSTFCVNSLAHYLGQAPFDDKYTPRDHFFTALLTFGEGYHNFHHEFPSDYRNALKWFQYDPTKWTIRIFEKLGMASNLKEFPNNEIKKGRYSMLRKELDEFADSITWPPNQDKLPVISFETYEKLASEDDGRSLVLIAGFVHDVSNFLDVHPGGRALLKSYVGKDATAAFHGGIHKHKNASHNLLAMMRVAICDHGGEVEHLKQPTEHSQSPDHKSD